MCASTASASRTASGQASSTVAGNYQQQAGCCSNATTASRYAGWLVMKGPRLPCIAACRLLNWKKQCARDLATVSDAIMASTDAEAPHAAPSNQRPPNITIGLPCFCLLSPQVWGNMASSTSCSSSNLTGTISTGMSLRTHAHIKPTTMLNLSSSTATSSSGADQAPQGTA